jgi:hypothetical protein
MSSFRSGTVPEAAVWFALFLVALSPSAGAQAPDPAALPVKSVRGKLERVDKSRNAIVMKSNTGERFTWQFDPAVIAEATRFKAGTDLVVIYRQLRPTEKSVTALAFPGTGSAPIYVNMTGSRVVLRSGPAVNGDCDQAGAGPVDESTIPDGGLAEIPEGCWCCAPSGETCTPANKTGLGRAFLLRCFK